MAHALRHLICWLGFAAWLHGQAAVPEIATVRFTVFAPRPIAGAAFVPHARAEPQPLVFYPTARSPRYEYRGAMPLRFVDTTNGQVVAEATIPPDLRDVLLLFLPIEPAPASGLRYQVAVLDDSAARHGPRGLAIVNLSGLTLAGTAGKEPLTLKAGLNPTLTVPRATNLTLRTTFKGRSYQAYSGTIVLSPRERALLLLLPPFYRGSLEVQSRLLVDQPPAAPAPAGGAR